MKVQICKAKPAIHRFLQPGQLPFAEVENMRFQFVTFAIPKITLVAIQLRD